MKRDDPKPITAQPRDRPTARPRSHDFTRHDLDDLPLDEAFRQIGGRS